MLRAVSLAAIVAVVPSALAQNPSPHRKPLLDKKPPELIADKDQWLAGAPVSLTQLHGRVVWLQFNF